MLPNWEMKKTQEEFGALVDAQNSFKYLCVLGHRRMTGHFQYINSIYFEHPKKIST